MLKSVHKLSCEHLFLFLLGVFLGVESLGHITVSPFEKLQAVSKAAAAVSLPASRTQLSDVSTSSLTLVI